MISNAILFVDGHTAIPPNREGLRAFCARHSFFLVHFASVKINSWLRAWTTPGLSVHVQILDHEHVILAFLRKLTWTLYLGPCPWLDLFELLRSTKANIAPLYVPGGNWWPWLLNKRRHVHVTVYQWHNYNKKWKFGNNSLFWKCGCLQRMTHSIYK